MRREEKSISSFSCRISYSAAGAMMGTLSLVSGPIFRHLVCSPFHFCSPVLSPGIQFHFPACVTTVCKTITGYGVHCVSVFLVPYRPRQQHIRLDFHPDFRALWPFLHLLLSVYKQPEILFLPRQSSITERARPVTSH